MVLGVSCKNHNYIESVNLLQYKNMTFILNGLQRCRMGTKTFLWWSCVLHDIEMSSTEQMCPCKVSAFQGSFGRGSCFPMCSAVRIMWWIYIPPHPPCWSINSYTRPTFFDIAFLCSVSKHSRVSHEDKPKIETALVTTVRTYSLPTNLAYILAFNPHSFYTFRGLKIQMRLESRAD